VPRGSSVRGERGTGAPRPGSGGDRDLEHAVALVREQLVGVLDVILGADSTALA
jgi:hypothetical protein